MQLESARNKAHHLLDKFTDVKMIEALNYLTFLDHLPDDQIDAIEELMEDLGWMLLGSEVVKDDWQ